MDLKEYSRNACKTRATVGSARDALLNATLGIAGEAGELVECVKKAVFQGHSLAPDKIASEIGDLMWYLDWLREMHGLEWNKILDGNINKLALRYPMGEFCSKDSQKRRDVKQPQ